MSKQNLFKNIDKFKDEKDFFKTSIRVDKDLWSKLKKHCIDKDIKIHEALDSAIKRELSG